MSIVPTIRKMLAEKDPARQDVPVWFTEVGEPVQGTVTPEHQADTLVKAYVMGIAQGALRIHWFEPLDGDSGPFGLIGGGNGSAPKRPSYTAVSKLIENLGHQPAYVGWLLLDTRHYAFVFDGPFGEDDVNEFIDAHSLRAGRVGLRNNQVRQNNHRGVLVRIERAQLVSGAGLRMCFAKESHHRRRKNREHRSGRQHFQNVTPLHNSPVRMEFFA